MESIIIYKMETVIGYADALQDLDILSVQEHDRIVRNKLEICMIIQQALNEHERLVKGR